GASGTDIGNVGRNVLRGPRQINIDFSVIKRFVLSETKSVEFRGEFFNLFNQINLANPVSNLNAATIDPVTGRIINPADCAPHTRNKNHPAINTIVSKVKFKTGRNRHDFTDQSDAVLGRIYKPFNHVTRIRRVRVQHLNPVEIQCIRIAAEVSKILPDYEG